MQVRMTGKGEADRRVCLAGCPAVKVRKMLFTVKYSAGKFIDSQGKKG